MGRRLPAVVALGALVASMVWRLPGFAHEAKILDRNDTRGPLDVSSASVRHGSTAVIHEIETFGEWTPGTLADDSYFAVLIDKDANHRTFEQCAFVVNIRGRLRGLLTNCGRKFLRDVWVRQPARNLVSVRIGTSGLRPGYRWAAASSFWGSGCPDGCLDLAPGALPLFIHDLARPTVDLTSPLLLSQPSAFEIEGSVGDSGGSGIGSWALSERALGGDAIVVESGARMSDVTYVRTGPDEGVTYRYELEAVDGQGNLATARSFSTVPWDESSPSFPGTFTGQWDATVDGGAYAGGLVSSASEDASVTLSFVVTGGVPTTFVWIAPGWGTWDASVRVEFAATSEDAAVSSSDVPDLPQQRVFERTFRPANDLHVTITVSSVSGAVPMDAVAMLQRFEGAS